MRVLRDRDDSSWCKIWWSSLAVVAAMGLQSCVKGPPETPPSVPATVPVPASAAQVAEVTPPSPKSSELADPESPAKDFVGELAMDPPLPLAVQPPVMAPVEAPPIEVPPVTLALREFTVFQHEFTAEQLNQSPQVSFDNLPPGAAYAPATRVLTWIPPEGSGGQDFELISQSVDGHPLGNFLRVLLKVQSAYQPPEYIAPQPLPPKSDKHGVELFVKHTQLILDAEVLKNEKDSMRFDELSKSCITASAQCGDETRFEVAKSLRMLEANPYKRPEYDVILESLEKADQLSQTAYLPASYLRLWAMVADNRTEDAISLFPAYGQVLIHPGVAPQPELCLRSYELGMLIGFIEAKANDKISLRLQSQVATIADGFADQNEAQFAFLDGINRMRWMIRAEQKQIADVEAKERDAQLAVLMTDKTERDQFLDEKKTKDEEIESLNSMWEEEAAPWREKLTEYKEKYDEVKIEQDDINREAKAIKDGAAAFKLAYDIAVSEIEAANNSGNVAASLAATAQKRSAETSGFAAEAKYKAKEVQYNAKESRLKSIQDQAAPSRKGLDLVDQKWQIALSSPVQASNDLGMKVDKVSEKINALEGVLKNAPRKARYQPNLRKLLPIDSKGQKRYLIDSLVLVMP